jgi:hypothetical protein
MQHTARVPSMMNEKKTGGRKKSRMIKSTAKMLVIRG